MKTIKFKVIQLELVGSFERIIEVRAKNLASARKKLEAIQGNRSWIYAGIVGYQS
jgi:hypothetical protein